MNKKEKSLRKYLYLWIKEFNRPDSETEKEDVLFENFGVSLSSEFDVKTDYNDSITFTIKRNELYQKGFFGTNINDLKVFAGKNGSGKTSLFKIISAILSKDTDYIRLQDLQYVLIFLEDGDLCVSKNISIEINVKGAFEEYKEKDGCSDCMVYYSAAFNAEKAELKNNDHYFDISTDYLIDHSLEELQIAERGAKIDKLTAYSLVEMDHNIDFVTDYIDDVKGWLNLPRFLKVSLDKSSLMKSIDEISKKTGDSSIDWVEYYNQLGFTDKVRFSAVVGRLLDYKDSDAVYEISRVRTLGPNKILEQFGLDDIVSKMIDLGSNFVEKSDYIFDVKDNHENLLSFKKAYNKIAACTGSFLKMEWRKMSSGEEAMMKFFGRFYHVLREFSSKKNQTIHLMIDEADLYLHPEWQRIWLKNTVDIIELMLDEYPLKRMEGDLYDLGIFNAKNLDIQIFISSHSPFILSDVPRDNCVLLSQCEDGKSFAINSASFQTFGANIYDIVKNEFFMGESLGEFVKTKINGCLKDMNEILEIRGNIKMLQKFLLRERDEKSRNAQNWGEEKKDLEEILKKEQIDIAKKKDEYKKIIYAIDEPILKTKMAQMFDEVFEEHESFELKTIQKYIDVLEQKKAELNGRSRG